MRHMVSWWLVVLVAGVVGAEPESGPPASVEDVGWLAGCWSRIGADEGSSEQWTAPAGGTMLGMARTVREGETVDHEFLLLRETEDDGLEYVALPSRQEPAAFRATEIERHRVVFSNPEHDFPQRIVYTLREDGILLARAEGTVSGVERGVDFPMERAPCPPGS